MPPLQWSSLTGKFCGAPEMINICWIMQREIADVGDGEDFRVGGTADFDDAEVDAARADRGVRPDRDLDAQRDDERAAGPVVGEFDFGAS